eukprot:MONOS_9830.1-p1 / transcript=MONOS_9830.1 / gene=MONOS_9830 / organism=Monocercomonoides_exilis_PA203 / gene_product=unspecified product / transcript_product=unspecified product / location=Mono_scaffold00420:39037-40336(+) / protein_length=387 / sequence_SO=supercontig / SO=protein_coding / is_pseudo=false
MEQFTEAEQKHKIEEMDDVMKEMDRNDFFSLFTNGYLKVLKGILLYGFEESSLNKRIEKMIIEEEMKEEEKRNEKLLIDICECYFLLNEGIFSETLSICVPCLLKAALKKEEDEETQKEKEIALLALSHIDRHYFFRQELYLKEITEIIKHQQKHRNLTKLAYQSVWKFLINRFCTNNFLEDTIVNELHFGREAVRELEELTRRIDWKKKKEERRKETEEEIALKRWLDVINYFIPPCKLWNEELVELINSIVQLFRAAKDNHSVISNQCIYPLRNAAEKRNMKIEDLLKSGAIDAISEEMHRRTLNEGVAFECLQFFTTISRRLEEKKRDEMEEEQRKATKMEIFEKMEEEGYEDIIASFHGVISIRYKYNRELTLNNSDYFVNV